MKALWRWLSGAKHREPKPERDTGPLLDERIPGLLERERSLPAHAVRLRYQDVWFTLPSHEDLTHSLRRLHDAGTVERFWPTGADGMYVRLADPE